MPTTEYGRTSVHWYGPWRIRYKAQGVLCSDGVLRTARLSAEPDTFFSIPASVQAFGKTVAGFVTGGDQDDPTWRFHANLWQKNAKVIPSTVKGATT